jgi:predicted GNAT family N-acyltransferase
VFGSLVFKVADAGERLRALELRRRVYEAELGHDGIDEFDDAAHQLIVCETGGEIVAALRVVGPEQRPFDLEKFLAISTEITANRSVGEVSRFCVRAEYRQIRKDQFIQLGMFKLLYEFAHLHSLTDLVTLSLPHLRSLYRVAFFRPLSPPFEHPTWGRVYPMRLDLVDLVNRHSKSQQPMARLLFASNLPNFLLGGRP